MKRVIRLAVVDPQDASRAQLKNLMLGVDTVWLEAECSRYEFFMDVAMQTQPDIALVALDANPTIALELIAKLRQQIPACAVLAVSTSQEGSLILQAMRNGAQEFLSIPMSLEDFLTALDRVRHSTHHGQGEDAEIRDSQVITVSGVNGGVGSTSVAVNLACVLAQDPHNTVGLIDLDLALGDADVWLDIIPDYTIQDVAENISRIDYSLLKRSLTKHESGLFLLPRPVHIDTGFHLGAEELRRVIALLKATFSHLIIDTGKSFSNMEMAAIGASDSTLLITQMDLPCLRNVVRIIHYFDSFDSLSGKLKIVLNRFGLSDNQISYNKALETIGRDVFWKIPNDYATMVESRNNGVPLIMQSPKAKLTRSYIEMAALLTNREEPRDKEQASKKTMFSFLSRGKG